VFRGRGTLNLSVQTEELCLQETMGKLNMKVTNLKLKRCKLRSKLNTKREREREIERERESGAVGATSTPSTVGLFSFLTMLFLPNLLSTLTERICYPINEVRDIDLAIFLLFCIFSSGTMKKW